VASSLFMSNYRREEVIARLKENDSFAHLWRLRDYNRTFHGDATKLQNDHF
jgi:hypothetical protein